MRRAAFSFAFILAAVASTVGQKVAVLAPEGDARSANVGAAIENTLGGKLAIQDASLALAAFKAASPGNPFNLTTEQSKSIGAAIGCDFFVLVRAVAMRRSSSSRPEYFEASAAIFAVSSRTGRLVEWKLLRFESSRPDRSEKMLNASLAPFARSLASKLKDTRKAEIAERPPAEMQETPAENSPAAKGFRAPIPYRRIKPTYTNDAYLYDVTATVDIVVDLNAAGSILHTEIVRWAGYGLDESVEATVRSMNWRPAERNGNPLPMRFLVRYNFKKVEH